MPLAAHEIRGGGSIKFAQNPVFVASNHQELDRDLRKAIEFEGGRMSDVESPVKQHAPVASRRSLYSASVAALGIVYGDLGTSPLYTMQTVLSDTGTRFDPSLAIGILSLIFWTLLVTISIKYCLFVMRADNHGEGGILALMSLVGQSQGRRTGVLVCCGLFGAALIYGDGIITPAISVLSALEGVNVATNALSAYIVPLAILILLTLFSAQHFGTARIGSLFGPVMLAWFLVIGLLGIAGIARNPTVLKAVDPAWAFHLLTSHGWALFIILGGVFLAVTGGEALYADMGHIGRNPIRLSWFLVVLPSLLLSYAGQTALLMNSPSGRGNPFFLLVPGWALYPTVVLAVIATIIASQAIITGAFSLTRQATQLGWLPGLDIRQTSDTAYGQIYVPFVNWTMMAFTLLLTIAFRSSDRLAGAYGTAVSTTMLLTTLLLYTAMRRSWGWSKPSAALAGVTFLIVDLAFFVGNLLKIGSGGWIPLLLGAVIFGLMLVWRHGVELLGKESARVAEAPEPFLRHLKENGIPRIPGTAVFLSRSTAPVPSLMARHVAQFGVLPSTAISLTIQFQETPRVKAADRMEIVEVAEGIWHITVRFGYVEIPNLPLVLVEAKNAGCPVDLDKATFFGGRDDVAPSKASNHRAGLWRILFMFVYRNAVHNVDRFSLPPEHFVEIGRRLEM